MEGPISYTVVFDASVLVPGFLSNLLLWLAEMDLFRAKWSKDIHTEWIRARKNRYEIAVEVSEARRQLIDEKFLDGLVTDYQSLIDGLTLPDVNDRHVLAAAIKCGANAIVTSNLRDFPEANLAPFNLVAIHQDDFILDQIYLKGYTRRLVAIAIVRHKKSMTRSRPTWKQYLNTMALAGVGLPRTYAEVSSQTFRQLIVDVLKNGDWFL